MYDLFRDLKMSARSIRRYPWFTLTAVLTLAVGIGTVTAIYTVANATFFRALPYHDASRVVQLWEATKEQPWRNLSWPDFEDVRREATAFQSIAALGYAGGMRLDSADGPRRVDGAVVSWEFFQTLGVSPVKGRTFAKSDADPAEDLPVILSDSFWRRETGADPHVVGKTISIEGSERPVIGVLPAGFHYAPAGSAEVWFVLRPTETQRERRFQHQFRAVARLGEGWSFDAAEAELRNFSARYSEQDPEWHSDSRFRIISIREQIAGSLRPVIASLAGAAALVFLIVVVNLGNLFVARALDRQTEIATRRALGASRWRLVSQMVAEGFSIGVMGAAGGMVLAALILKGLVRMMPDEILFSLPFLHGLALDARAIGFAMAASFLASLTFSFAAAIVAARWAESTPVHAVSRIVGPAGGLRSALVVMQIGLAMALLISAGLLYRSSANLSAIDVGFETDRVLSMRLELPDDEEDRVVQIQEVLRRIVAVPGVRDAGIIDALPLTEGGSSGTPMIEGQNEDPRERFSTAMRTVTPGYFDTIGVPLIEGRFFNEDDTGDRPLVAVINSQLADRLFPGESPLGRRITFPWLPEGVAIIGVVGAQKIGLVDEQDGPVIYWSAWQDAPSVFFLMVRSENDPRSVLPSVRDAIQSTAPRVLVDRIRTMDQVVNSSPPVFLRRYPMTLIGCFALAALLLSAIGIYGIMSLMAARRRREIGVRMALGATPDRVFRLILGRGLGLALGGVLVGLSLSLVTSRILEKVLFHVEATDPLTYACAAAGLLVIALVASGLPARSASRIEAATVLRSE